MPGKVLVVASTFDHLERFHKPYIEEFRRLGYETHIACAGAPERPGFADRSIELPFRKRMLSLKNLAASRAVRKAVKTGEYDLVISHTALAAFFTRLAMRGLRNRPASCVMVHGYLFDANTSPLRRFILLSAERMTAGQTDLLLVMNAEDLDTASRYRLCSRIESVPGIGVDFSRLDAAGGERTRAEFGFPGDSYVLLNAAEFSSRKSQSVLVKAMSFLPDGYRLILAGDGDRLDECRRLALSLGVSDRIAFPGRVGDVGALMRISDAYVTASRSEGLPFSVMEAMHLGLPVAASRVKGHVDLVEEGVTGALYAYGDEKACAAAICAVRSLDSVRLAERAPADVEPFSLERVFPLVMRAYLSLLGRREDQ